MLCLNVFFLKARLDPCYFFVSLGFAFLDFLNKVVGFSDGSVGMHFDNIHVHVLSLVYGLSSDHITDIDNALFTIVSVIVKENMLCRVVRLVYHQKLGVRIQTTRFLPCWKVFLERHGTMLLEGLEDSLEDI
jgi:hypothetical protein